MARQQPPPRRLLGKEGGSAAQRTRVTPAYPGVRLGSGEVGTVRLCGVTAVMPG